MTKNNSKRNHVESDVPCQNSSEAKKETKEDDQVKVVNNKECLTGITAYSFIQFSKGNAVPHNGEQILQTNGQG